MSLVSHPKEVAQLILNATEGVTNQHNEIILLSVKWKKKNRK